MKRDTHDDNQHNDTQLKNTQHNDNQHDTQHNYLKNAILIIMTLSIMVFNSNALCHFAD